MYVVLLLLAALVVIGVLLLAGVSAGVKASRTRRAFVFLALTALPGLWTLGLLVRADATMKTVGFCLRCHEMEPFGDSMRAERPDILSATHYAAGAIDRERACYDCHSQKTIRGAIDAKITGLNDVRIHYLGSIPEMIELKRPYDSGICVGCHGEAAVRDQFGHPTALIADINEDRLSCLDCHGPGH